MANSIPPPPSSEKWAKDSFTPNSDLDSSAETSSDDVEKLAQENLGDSDTNVDEPRQVVGFKVQYLPSIRLQTAN